MARIYNLNDGTVIETPKTVVMRPRLLSEDEQKRLQAQYRFGSNMNQLVQVKLFHPLSDWTWYLMNQDPEDHDYLWAIVRGFEVEMGSVSLSESGRLARPVVWRLHSQGVWSSTVHEPVSSRAA
jgi:hypothetical protein